MLFEITLITLCSYLKNEIIFKFRIDCTLKNCVIIYVVQGVQIICHWLLRVFS